MSIREEAARVAMLSALSNGATIAEAHLAAQEAAAAVNPLPPLAPVELTDAELRQYADTNELSCAEMDRLDELEAQDEREFQAALDATLPKGRVRRDDAIQMANDVEAYVAGKMTEDQFLDQAKELAEDHDREVMAAAGDDFMPDAYHHELSPTQPLTDKRRDEIRAAMGEDHMTDALGPNCASCYDPECLGDCPERGHKLPPVCTVSDDCGDCTMCFDPDDDNEGDCPRSGSPGFAADMAAEFAAAQHDAYASLQGRDDPVDAGDFGAGTRGNPTPPELRAEGLAAFMRECQAEATKEVEAHNTRDCDIPATLRAVDIPPTENGNGIQQWFDNHGDMLKFLASRQSFIEGTMIKDYEGNTVGMWFYAHFGTTPVS